MKVNAKFLLQHRKSKLRFIRISYNCLKFIYVNFHETGTIWIYNKWILFKSCLHSWIIPVEIFHKICFQSRNSKPVFISLIWILARQIHVYSRINCFIRIGVGDGPSVNHFPVIWFSYFSDIYMYWQMIHIPYIGVTWNSLKINRISCHGRNILPGLFRFPSWARSPFPWRIESPSGLQFPAELGP